MKRLGHALQKGNRREYRLRARDRALRDVWVQAFSYAIRANNATTKAAPNTMTRKASDLALAKEGGGLAREQQAARGGGFGRSTTVRRTESQPGQFILRHASQNGKDFVAPPVPSTPVVMARSPLPRQTPPSPRAAADGDSWPATAAELDWAVEEFEQHVHETASHKKEKPRRSSSGSSSSAGSRVPSRLRGTDTASRVRPASESSVVGGGGGSGGSGQKRPKSTLGQGRSRTPGYSPSSNGSQSPARRGRRSPGGPPPVRAFR